MDDLELLRIERQVSNEEREKENAGRRSLNYSHADRHHPHAEPEDAFHTLTEPVPLPPVAKPEKKVTFLGRSWKKLRKFPRVVRYLLYVRVFHI